MGRRDILNFPVGAAIQSRLLERIDKACSAAADLNQTEAVHDVRKAIKRLRALLRLLEPLQAEARDLRNSTGALARNLSSVRDVQSGLNALGALGRAKLVTSATLEAMQSPLLHVRREAEAGAANPALKETLQLGLRHAGATIEHWQLDLSFADLVRGLANTYRQARRALPDDWDDAEPEALHRLRRRVIEHRYQMALVKPIWPDLGALWVAEAQRLRDELGLHHDLTGLAAQTIPGQPLARWRKQLAPMICTRQADCIAAARRHSRHLFAEKPKGFYRRIAALGEPAISAD